MENHYDWPRLARYTVARREDLGISTRRGLAQATGLSYRLLGDLERGVRELSEGTLAILEQALRWQQGSARAVLTGGEPTALNAHATIPDTGPLTSPPWSRSLSEAYRIAADLEEAGQIAAAGRLTRALGDISQSATELSLQMLDASTEFRTMMARLTTSNDKPQPTVIGIGLGQYMRQLRVKSQLTADRVGELLGWPTADIWLLEIGQITLDKNKIRQILTLYGEETPHVHQECTRLAAEAARSGWWTRYDDVLPDWFKSYLHLERSSRVIRTVETQFIPGLLQTPEYARSVMSFLGEVGIERRVHLRMERQKVLLQPNAPHLWALIDEAVLNRPPVGASVMRKQIQHLLGQARMSNIVIQILSADEPLYAYASPFTLLKMRDPGLPHLVYIDQLTSALYLDRQEDVDVYRMVLDKLSTVAMTPEDSLERLGELLDEYTSAVQPVPPRRLMWHSAAADKGFRPNRRTLVPPGA
ncbi:helix-turn-helix transcriptional regulator [Nocardia rhamnosiphila]|uniref:helix-turn-helix transcriptional regulator n=1 Tax=Nocardia rhamnosiphila TaxID=426716 RepID=UPI0037A52918